ncbi:MAG TPA: pyridoxamine 5'-phosphate oxidase family protein [Candidatus Dormibacteraeota bacterium]|nr:pyridoxamine 5'-phosphate oxidase family protein [Candidatus Dormibacteraeota bacterium]
MADAQPRSRRTTVRRHPERGRYDRHTIEAILDEALIGHLGVTTDGRPHVIPMMYARRGDSVYVHGAAANQALGALRQGAEACLVVTLLDGLVMARSAFNHSMNYRSVVVIGKTREVSDAAEKMAAMEALLEHVARGRWQDTRHPSKAEFASTVILALKLDEASAKVRSGDPVDDPDDLVLIHWAGVIPMSVQPGPAIAARDLATDIPTPSYARRYRRPGAGTD